MISYFVFGDLITRAAADLTHLAEVVPGFVSADAARSCVSQRSGVNTLLTAQRRWKSSTRHRGSARAKDIAFSLVCAQHGTSRRRFRATSRVLDVERILQAFTAL